MQPGYTPSIESPQPVADPQESKRRFRQHFQRSLRACVRRHFAVEEAFGLIFAETLQEVSLTPSAEAELFEELLRWARDDQHLFPAYSTSLFTDRQARNR